MEESAKRTYGAASIVARKLAVLGLKQAARMLAVYFGIPLGVALVVILVAVTAILGIYGATASEIRDNPARAGYQAAADEAAAPVISEGAQEREHALTWGFLYAVDYFEGLVKNAPPEFRPDDTAKNLAPRFEYRDSDVTVTRTILDDSGNTKAVTETRGVKLLTEADTYRGIYRYFYRKVTTREGGETVTREVQDRVEFTPDLSRLSEYLARRLGGPIEPELPFLVARAGDAFTSGQPDFSWLEDEDESAFSSSGASWGWESTYDGPGLVAPAWPVRGTITSPFGPRKDPLLGGRDFHNGVDIAVSYGTPVLASGAGEVRYAGWVKGYGLTVVLDHGNKTMSLYGHNSTLLVREGQKVEKGLTIALAGSTGRSTGPHVHWEIRVRGTAMDPLKFIRGGDQPPPAEAGGLRAETHGPRVD